jgi:F420-0:gamma-glutamyl ligase-like protein
LIHIAQLIKSLKRVPGMRKETKKSKDMEAEAVGLSTYFNPDSATGRDGNANGRSSRKRPHNH